MKSFSFNSDQFLKFKSFALKVENRLKNNTTFCVDEFDYVLAARFPDTITDMLLNIMNSHNSRILDSSNT